MKKILVVFGTRPEAIKMCPLVNELKKRTSLETLVCVTGQHREMLDVVLKTFQVVPDFDLSIMQPKQTLFDITTNILNRIKAVLEQVHPDVVLVHGDTSTTFVTALACFYMQIPFGHVEAGLRTYNLYSPCPEEFNRQTVSLISRFNFAPTELAKQNLLKEGKDPQTIYVTGNTAIDTLKTTVKADYHHPELDWAGDSRLILITAHRRENLGEPMKHMFRAIRRVLDEHDDVKAIYPIHLNPLVRETANEIFGSDNRIHLIEPLDVLDFHNFMSRSYMILTDSGGIQEEAPSLGKPVLVMRDTTERPEGVTAGTLKLVGTTEDVIYKEFTRLLDSKAVYDLMSKASNPYGDGEERKNLQKMIDEFHVSSNIMLVGKMVNPYPVIKHADLMVHTSYGEAHCTSVLEAMALNTPCIVTETYIPQDFTIDEYNCYMVKQDVDSLVQKMMSVMSNLSETDQLTNNAFNFVNCNYTPEVIISRFEKFLN